MGNMKHLLHRRLCVCLQLLKARAFPINTQKSINVQQVQVGFGLRWLRLALGQAEEVKRRVPGCISGPDGPRPRPNDLHSLVIGDATTTTSCRHHHLRWERHFHQRLLCLFRACTALWVCAGVYTYIRVPEHTQTAHGAGTQQDTAGCLRCPASEASPAILWASAAILSSATRPPPQHQEVLWWESTQHVHTVCARIGTHL